MEIAIPIDEQLSLYRKNPFTSPRFAIYQVDLANKVVITQKRVVENPLAKINGHFETDQINGSCSNQSELKHICEHYSILEVLSKVSFLLACSSCTNLKKSLKNVGITIYQIPPIIQEVETALKNFLIGASYANKTQDIHNVS